MTNKDNNSSLKIEQSVAEITTIDQLAQSLADHTRVISDEIIIPALKQSKEYKPIIEFFHSVKKHLIHDLSHEEFADLYAQTLTFGLTQSRRGGTNKVILATEDTEDTEFKKNLLSVNSVRSVAKNILPVKRRKKSWISELLEDYKKIEGKRLEERNLKWLQEDYVRFIRFAQHPHN